MSENISIKEAGQSRLFGSVERLETDTTDGNSCFWVPESERQLESAHITQNGDYTPEKYAFSDITVNVAEPIHSTDGTDWDISVQPVDPSVPEIGVPTISIPDSDIDLTVDPATGIPVVTIGGEEIDLPDISEDLDLTGNIDISVDTEETDLIITGSDFDGLDVGLNIDLDSLNIGLHDLPDTIEILITPSKTDYQEGEIIRLSGIKVVAKRNGAVWTNADYPDGVIPVGELGVSPLYATAKGSVERIADVGSHTFPVFYGDRLIQYVTNMHDISWHEWERQYHRYYYEAFLSCVKSKTGAPFVAMSWGTDGKTALEYAETWQAFYPISGGVDSNNIYSVSVSENRYLKPNTGFFSLSNMPMYKYVLSYYIRRQDGSRADAMSGLMQKEASHTPTELSGFFFKTRYSGQVYHSAANSTPAEVYGSSGSFYTGGLALPVGTVPDSFLSHFTGTWDYWSVSASDMQRIVLSAVYDGVSPVNTTVNWHRPYDNKQLSANFNITVSGNNQV